MEHKKERLLELRQLHYFITLADELHFARAAERLQMEQSPLSRAIREMEGTWVSGCSNAAPAAPESLALAQSCWTTRDARLRWWSKRRRAPDRPPSDKAASYASAYRIARRIAEANPSIAVSLLEMPLHQQISGLRDGLVDASISLDGSYREGIEAQAVAHDPICVAVPIEHPLANGRRGPTC